MVTTVVRTVLDVADGQLDEELVASVADDALDTGAMSMRQLERRMGGLRSDAQARAKRVLSRRSRSASSLGGPINPPPAM